MEVIKFIWVWVKNKFFFLGWKFDDWIKSVWNLRCWNKFFSHFLRAKESWNILLLNIVVVCLILVPTCDFLAEVYSWNQNTSSGVYWGTTTAVRHWYSQILTRWKAKYWIPVPWMTANFVLCRWNLLSHHLVTQQWLWGKWWSAAPLHSTKVHSIASARAVANLEKLGKENGEEDNGEGAGGGGDTTRGIRGKFWKLGCLKTYFVGGSNNSQYQRTFRDNLTTFKFRFVVFQRKESA